MEFIGYGEDALTLWALKEKFSEILMLIGDNSEPNSCKIFYRPSFGRGRSGFGEFDFIILADQVIYLGESKWNKSSEKNKNGPVMLRDEQIKRHDLFVFYFEKWASGEYASWDDFQEQEQEHLAHSIPDANSLLAKNIKNIFDIIKKHYVSQPHLKNVLLFLHNGEIESEVECEEFKVVPIDYSEVTFADNFIRLEL
uniref:hypothetical protein n=1 Tax=Candidatus Electronema sp. TaxID=2698783 RepID=UPI004055D2F4